MRSDIDSVIRIINRQLPIDCLKLNLVIVYKKYKQFYGDLYITDAFKHGEESSDDEDNDNDDDEDDDEDVINGVHFKEIII